MQLLPSQSTMRLHSFTPRMCKATTQGLLQNPALLHSFPQKCGIPMDPRLKAPRAGAPSHTQQCFPHSAPGKYPPPFINWFLAGANLSVSSALRAAVCAMEGLQGASAKDPGQHHQSPLQGLILQGPILPRRQLLSFQCARAS